MHGGLGQVHLTSAGDFQVDAGLQHRVGGGFAESLLQHPDPHGFALREEQDCRENQQCLRSVTPGWHFFHQRLKVTPRPSRIAGPEQITADTRPPAPRGLERDVGREPNGELAQFRRDPGSAPSSRRSGGLV